MNRVWKSLALIVLSALPMGGAPAAAAPIELGWADLIPASAVIGERVQVLEGIVQHSQVTNAPENADGPTTSIEELMGISSPVEYRVDLNGAEVKISGYVLPLAFDGTDVTDFLLVPFVGACIHVPPPPANQLVLVHIEGGYPAGSLWESVSVTGKLSLSGIETDLASVGYSIEAAAVDKI